MKILFIVHSVSWKGGGAFFHAFHLAKELAEQGNETYVLSISSQNKFRFKKYIKDRVNIIESPDLLKGSARSGWDPYNTLRRILFLFNKKFDVVQCLDCRPAVIFPGLFMKYVKGSKLVIEWLDWFGKGGTATEREYKSKSVLVPLETFFEERFRKYADGSIGLGEPLTQRIYDAGISQNVITILHGCDPDIKSYDKNECRDKLNLRKDAVIIGYTGRMRKDVASLFTDIIRKLKTKTDKKVIGISIGNTAYDFDKFITDDIKDNIIKTGWISYEEVNLHLCACDILILPFESTVARNGIWPSKVNDYLSSGRPIISTDLKVLQNLNTQYSFAVLVPSDSEQFAKECIKLLNNKELYSKLSQNALSLSKTALSWKNVAYQVSKFYKSL